MSIASSWWRFVRWRCRIGRDGYPYEIWWFYLKHWPNCSTLWPAAPVLSIFLQYLIAVCSWTETASDIISGSFVGPIVPDKHVQFPDPRLKSSRFETFHSKSPEAAFSTDISRYLRIESCWWRTIRFGCRVSWCRCPCKIRWFYVIRLTWYTTASLCDGSCGNRVIFVNKS